MLDRGEFKDWFGSTEIIVYAVLCGLGFYLFLVHMLTAKAPLIPPRIFRDMNFSAGLAMIFAVGMLRAGDRGAARALPADSCRAFGGRNRTAAGAARRRHHGRLSFSPGACPIASIRG